MMKVFYSVLVFFLVLSFQTKAQYYNIDIGEVETVNCEFDSAISISSFSKIRMYSTLNNQWDGVIDSSECYSMTQVGNYWRFLTESVDSGQAIFFEIELDSILPLDTSTVFILNPATYLFDEVIVGLQMPDSSGLDSTTSYQVLTSPYSDAICFPTQKVVGQALNKLVFKHTSYGYDSQVSFYGPSIEEHWDGTQIIPQISYPNTDWGPYLVRYWHDIYPTADSISYTDILPWGAPTDSTLIQFYVDYYSSLHFQDYTALRGALVDGSDSIRHGLEVILDGNMCIPWVEVFWEGGTHLVANGGSIDFHGSTGCNLFGKGGGLKVKSGNTLRYGKEGVGMLALKTNAQLTIESGAELIIDGPVFMYEYWDDPEPSQLFMELPIGAKLSFAEGASLSNQYSLDGSMRLNVFMKGGEIDLSGLSVSEQELVNLIYETPNAKPEENLIVYPNPTNGNTSIVWIAEESGKEIECNLFDVSGKRVSSWRFTTTNPGFNTRKVSLDDLNSGIYILNLVENGNVAKQKLIKN